MKARLDFCNAPKDENQYVLLAYDSFGQIWWTSGWWEKDHWEPGDRSFVGDDPVAWAETPEFDNK